MNAPATALTKRDLIERGVDALDTAKLATADVQHRPGSGVSQVNLPQVVEVAKFMASSGQGVPLHCRGNVGICLRITFQAVEWQMSPFSVADMSFIVNDRISYMSQLIHAVIEARAPIQHRIDCRYDGEGPERMCTVIGQFISGDTREYTSPKVKDIKTKNSPLWKDDLDQQLFYFSSRSWARKWCPDVLLGVYTREELLDRPQFEPDEGSGLARRLAAGANKSSEGHHPDHAARELAQIAGAGQTIDNEPADKPGKKAKRIRAKAGKGAKDKPAEPATPPADHPPPSNPAEWSAYATDWIKTATDADAMDLRWAKERAMRNNCGVTSEQRQPIEAMLIDQREKLAKGAKDG